jgi:hypothetical protein
MLYLVNDAPFITFEHLGIDFERLYVEASELMIRCPVTSPGSNGGQRSFISDPPGMIHPEELTLTAHDLSRLESFGSEAERFRYAKIVKGAYAPWSIYSLNEMRDWSRRQDGREAWLPAARELMPYFVRTIESLPFIAEIGWARIYANEAFNFVHVHADHSDNIRLDQFVYFNLCGKRTFLLDPQSGEKTYLSAKALFFDAANLHGTDAEPRFSFSIRVDCKFKPAFRDSLKLSRFGAGDHASNPRFVRSLWRG